MASFKDYRDGVGGQVARTILARDISHLNSWKEFFNFSYQVSCAAGPQVTHIFARAEVMYNTGHVGQRAVVLATLFAMDRSDRAIKLEKAAGENLLGILRYADAQHRAAVAACLQLKD